VVQIRAQPFYDVATKSTRNFVQVPPDPIQLEAYQWTIDWVSGIDPYAGLLVNRHRTGLWAARYHTVSTPPPPPRRPLSELVAKFMAHNETRQEPALQSLDRDEFAINYHMLQVWNLLSLHLCGGERKAQTFEPVPTGYDGSAAQGRRLTVTPIDETALSIDPISVRCPPIPRVLCLQARRRRLPERSGIPRGLLRRGADTEIFRVRVTATLAAEGAGVAQRRYPAGLNTGIARLSSIASNATTTGRPTETFA
jgi:hypothetical protein